jgi:hypothetical protein
LEFDSEQFFKIIVKAFIGQPLKYLASQKEYYDKNQVKGGPLCITSDIIINEILADRAKKGDD